MKRLSLALLLFAASTARAQFFPDPDYQRVLIPVFYFGGGSFGSQWWTDFDLISTTGDFTLGRAFLQGDPACPALCGCDAKTLVENWKSESVCPTFEGPAGLVLHVPRTVTRDEVHTYARVRDLSRQADRAGTQIPVVWEDQLRDGMMLLDIPRDDRFRSTLRLFDVFQWPTEFQLRFYDMAKLRRGEAEPLLETTVMVQHEEGGTPGRFPGRPAYAVVGDLQAAYPQLANVQSFAIEIRGMHLLISPAPPNKRFFAMVSVTNKNTNEVTVVAPE
jgi:hypothetical protein